MRLARRTDVCQEAAWRQLPSLPTEKDSPEPPELTSSAAMHDQTSPRRQHKEESGTLLGNALHTNRTVVRFDNPFCYG